MMPEFILILAFLAQDLGGTTSVPGFKTKEACERAGAAFQQHVAEVAPRTAKALSGLLPVYVCVSNQ